MLIMAGRDRMLEGWQNAWTLFKNSFNARLRKFDCRFEVHFETELFSSVELFAIPVLTYLCYPTKASLPIAYHTYRLQKFPVL